jgi:hypothetical protein
MRWTGWINPTDGIAESRMTLIGLAVTVILSAPVAAQNERDGPISEIRAGLFYHDAAIFVAPGERDEHRVERTGVDANFELLFRSPDFLKIIGSPRPHIGATVNTRPTGRLRIRIFRTPPPAAISSWDAVFCSAAPLRLAYDLPKIIRSL